MSHTITEVRPTPDSQDRDVVQDSGAAQALAATLEADSTHCDGEDCTQPLGWHLVTVEGRYGGESESLRWASTYAVVQDGETLRGLCEDCVSALDEP